MMWHDAAIQKGTECFEASTCEQENEHRDALAKSISFASVLFRMVMPTITDNDFSLIHLLGFVSKNTSTFKQRRADRLVVAWFIFVYRM
jgi:hypothetical protein